MHWLQAACLRLSICSTFILPGDKTGLESMSPWLKDSWTLRGHRETVTPEANAPTSKGPICAPQGSTLPRLGLSQGREKTPTSDTCRPFIFSLPARTKGGVHAWEDSLRGGLRRGREGRGAGWAFM